MDLVLMIICYAAVSVSVAMLLTYLIFPRFRRIRNIKDKKEVLKDSDNIKE